MKRRASQDENQSSRKIIDMHTKITQNGGKNVGKNDKDKSSRNKGNFC